MSHNIHKRLFLSCATSEFGSYRELLTGDLKRPTLEVKVQADFGVTGRTTLEKLDKYIKTCDGMVHLIGGATGASAETPAVERLLTLSQLRRPTQAAAGQIPSGVAAEPRRVQPPRPRPLERSSAARSA
jgi:hypothetical protein